MSKKSDQYTCSEVTLYGHRFPSHGVHVVIASCVVKAQFQIEQQDIQDHSLGVSEDVSPR